MHRFTIHLLLTLLCAFSAVGVATTFAAQSGELSPTEGASTPLDRGELAPHVAPPDAEITTPQRRVGSPLDEVGFTQLQTEISGLENGSGLLVNQVEAGSGAYMPDTTQPEFAGKSFTDGSGYNSGAFAHATGVGLRQYGIGVSLAPGTTNITVYDANDWLVRVLGFNTQSPPLPQNYAVMNHSYVANGIGVAGATELNRRMDSLVEVENATVAVGTNNGAANPIPELFAHSYNTITVGRSDGNHAHGLTTLIGPGRVKPEIVAPESSVSNATPMVAAAAALLREQGQSLGNVNASNNEVIKAVLLAGATKDEFPAWSNTDLQPLDPTYGAGELNIYNSYHIMGGGESEGVSQGQGPPPAAPTEAWDYHPALSTSNSRYYRLLVGSQAAASIVLTWNAELQDGGGALDYDTLVLANLDLTLHDSSAEFPGPPIATSGSSVDNIEHLYLPELAPGAYTIGVSAIGGTTDFAVAWQFQEDGTAVDVPSSGRAGTHQLYAAQPNPFNPGTMIRFDLTQSEAVTLTVYDVAGRRVRALVQGTRDAGTHDVIWRGLDDNGRPVASGVYLYRLEAGPFVETRRMTLIK